ncbi:large-conductance mechanosensitive channel protein MscL [uncultured Acetobacteroides sp.]|uniref:large-conductance mechanosensitive channel protein MscL n=1 Tax=uncultured Acetobacteroides sp. TaxID=1760811 RepID=UPI0029F46D3E|nr:large-conductance mechanosensitive channel protein MscL [uncultured Acetobacteroides sp.]
MSFIKEFKDFISKGSVIDLAVAVVIGGAFGQIVSSAVNDILMPVVGLLLGGIDFASWKITLKEAVVAANGTIGQPAVTMNIGSFIQVTVNFLLIALFIFIALKGLMHLKRQKAAAPPAPAAPSQEAQLLAEIRDLLKKEQG